MNRRGTTLMEMLIAITLLSLLVGGVLMSLRTGVTTLERTNQRFLANRRVLGTQHLLEQQLAGFLPVTASCIAAGGLAPTDRIAFFQGESQTMRLATTYSLDEGGRGYPRILEYQVIAGENGVGVRLVVNELLYAGPLSAGRMCFGLAPDPAAGISVPRFTPVEVTPNSFVLADKLATCRFSYREPHPPPLLERWVTRWVRPFWPSAIRIEMTPLNPSENRVLPLTLTIPIKVNRVPGGQYFD